MACAELLIAGEGFTVSLNGEKTPTVGYVCGGFGTDFMKPLDEFTELDLLVYVKDNANEFVKGAFLGGWVSDGIVYLDVSQVFTDLEFAKLIGRKNKQKALWDLANSQDINL